MTSQDDRRTMEAMLASIREAIHRETAMQMAGLHKTGDRVVVDHEPVSGAVATAVVDGEEATPPDYLRPLEETSENDLMPSSGPFDGNVPAAERTFEGAKGHDAVERDIDPQPMRLAAGAETDVNAVGSVEDLFEGEPEKTRSNEAPQACQHDSLFEDILAGRRSAGPIGLDRSTEAWARSGDERGWQEPASRSHEAVLKTPSSAANSSEWEMKREPASFGGSPALEQGASSGEGSVVAGADDPLNEIDLDDDIIWTSQEGETAAHDTRAAEGSVHEEPVQANEDVDGDCAADDGGEEAALVAPEVAERVAEAFGRLDAEMLLGALGGSAALERMVRQEMRPLLREWLNAHLPALVERIIREEIRRIVHGGRGGHAL